MIASQRTRRSRHHGGGLAEGHAVQDRGGLRPTVVVISGREQGQFGSKLVIGSFGAIVDNLGPCVWRRGIALARPQPLLEDNSLTTRRDTRR